MVIHFLIFQSVESLKNPIPLRGLGGTQHFFLFIKIYILGVPAKDVFISIVSGRRYVSGSISLRPPRSCGGSPFTSLTRSSVRESATNNKGLVSQPDLYSNQQIQIDYYLNLGRKVNNILKIIQYPSPSLVYNLFCKVTPLSGNATRNFGIKPLPCCPLFIPILLALIPFNGVESLSKKL